MRSLLGCFSSKFLKVRMKMTNRNLSAQWPLTFGSHEGPQDYIFRCFDRKGRDKTFAATLTLTIVVAAAII